MSSSQGNGKHMKADGGVSRRGFLEITGAGSAVATVVLDQPAGAQSKAASVGPGRVAITLNVNGKDMKANVEPRETLLDTLRDQLDHTGAKRVCDRGTCGACTVMMDGLSVYSCSVLAIDAQNRKIETVEGLTADLKNDALVNAFVEHDAQQCGYCTPGFMVAAKMILKETPKPTFEEVEAGLSGNLCRCGTYVGLRDAVVDAGRRGRV
ncbi:MAG: (2Fe-2S)-binding protein [Bryobacterales bacterium]|nr:(2Fe-2S)-binding protein [Bryobacterales bacterium]